MGFFRNEESFRIRNVRRRVMAESLCLRYWRERIHVHSNVATSASASDSSNMLFGIFIIGLYVHKALTSPEVDKSNMKRVAHVFDEG